MFPPFPPPQNQRPPTTHHQYGKNQSRNRHGTGQSGGVGFGNENPQTKQWFRGGGGHVQNQHEGGGDRVEIFEGTSQKIKTQTKKNEKKIQR